MKNSFWIIRIMVGLMLAATVLSSCAPKKHGKCRGLKAHPSYSKKWKR